MIVEKLSGWSAIALLVLSQLAAAQSGLAAKTGPSTNNAVPKTPTLADYQALLSDPDIAGDPDIFKAIYGKWVDLSCKQKQAKVAAVGITDLTMSKEVYTTCSTRLLAQGPTAAVNVTTPVSPTGTAPPQNSAATPVASVPANTDSKVTTGSTALTQDQKNALDVAVGSLIVPAGCSVLPSPSKKVDPALQPPSDLSPIPMVAANVPQGWLQLNPNSSGGEHHTKSTVWVGYVNRLRYTATLGGVVTPIAAPTLPNNIFPSPAVTPAAKTAPSNSGAPLNSSASVNNFNQLNKCIDDIQKETLAFQQNLSGFETSLNASRIRILARLSNLTPIVNSSAEARSAADLTLFPTQTAPPFPLAEVIALRGLLGQVATEYSQIAQWAGTSPTVLSTYTSETASATATSKELDAYLSSSGLPLGTQASGSNGTGGGSPAPGTSGNSAGATRGTAQAAPQPAGSATVNATPPPAAPVSSGGNGQSAPATQAKTDACSSHLDSGSQEVNDYEDNRCYIDTWRNTFRTVVGANDLYFVVSYTPVCGGWFGQGTSTQMQLTINDSTQAGASASPINLDKIVCQSPLTVSNGIGLSFVASHIPAFVPGVKKDSSGNPVLDASGNPTIVQTLGYSSTAAVNPSYSILVNGALTSVKGTGVEFHWAAGAMLTASTSGTTTDILIGPSISFRKRAFFISPVYDLGLRTDYQNGFALGMPQGNLTSPPTSQNWRSGFGLTITFPFTQSSSNQNSSGGAGGTPSTSAPAGGSPKQATPSTVTPTKTVSAAPNATP